MKREIIDVKFCREDGDESLPPLAELFSDTPDPMKQKILSYLRNNSIILYGMGFTRDKYNPEKLIKRIIYSDGKYTWSEFFAYYVQNYNVPVPTEFREHVLKNFNAWLKRNTLFRLADSVEIHNNPFLGFQYEVRIFRSGMIQYRNTQDCRDGALMYVNPQAADSIFNSAMQQLFCYEAEDQGQICIDGYHWEMQFYRKNGDLIDRIEGWDGEDPWRRDQFHAVIKCAERFIHKDLGGMYMDEYWK